MERNVNYMIVGFVVITAFAGIIFFASWVIGGLDKNSYKHYSVIFDEAIGGLNVSSAVLYKGVRVGQVTAIKLAPDQPDIVQVNIKVREMTPVQSYTKVGLGLQGITGTSNIELDTPVGPPSPPPEMEGYAYPVLKGDSRQLAKLLEDMPKIASNVLDITEKLNKALDDDTVTSLQATAQNLQQVTQDLNRLLSEENITRFSTTLENAEQITNEFSGLSSTISSQVNGTAEEVETLINELTKTVQASEESLEKLTNKGLDQVLSLVNESKKMAREIRQLADSLEQNPSQIIYQQPDNKVDIPQ